MSSSAPSSSAENNRFEDVRAVYGDAAFQKIQAAKVLVVGAGGIGCELLKCMVMTGFQDIYVVDLDTIDVSNLNRQFLFRREHVSKSKSLIARESVLQFNPHVQITAHHGNIKEDTFDSAFFQRFHVVFNALDNVGARRHVNRMCLGANVPLIESGTQGYLGQVVPILPHTTECFECKPQPTQKTYAVCTIRNTPELPVHCIVWAKSVYATLFGPEDETNIMADQKIAIEGDTGTGNSTSETRAASSFAVRVFNFYFKEEIEKQREVTDRWVKRVPPEPLNLAALLQAYEQEQTQEQGGNCGLSASADQLVLPVCTQAALFVRTINRLLRDRRAELGQLSFDKDDDIAMDFVAYAANLRMTVFGIARQSRFAVKGIAGNIIHAIATTNAIAAGLIVLEGVKVIRGAMEKCRSTYIQRNKSNLLQPGNQVKPNPLCFACNRQTVPLRVNTHRFTLKQFYGVVCKKLLGMNEPDVDNVAYNNYIGAEEDDRDGLEDEYLAYPLSHGAIKMVNSALVRVSDMLQDITVDLAIVHDDTIQEEDHPDLCILDGSVVPREDNAAAAAAESAATLASTVAAASSSSASLSALGSNSAVVNLEVDGDEVAAPSSSTSSFSSSSSLASAKRKRSKEDEDNTGGAGTKRSALSWAGEEGDADILDLT